ncbi:MAG: amino acid ABC transporter substrate-binding protein [Magnetospirillum sp.]
MAKLRSIIAVSAFFLLSFPALAGTLDDVRQRGDVRCGVFPDDPGRSALSAAGRWEGFYVDFCRAVAVAVLGDAEAVRFVEVGPQSRFTSLVDRRVDVVMYSSTRTLGRENIYGIAFPAVYLFDGQGVMVRANSGINSLKDFEGRSICVTPSTTSQANLESLLRQNGIDTKIVYANGDAFFRGNCDGYTADRVNLAINRANRSDDPKRYRMLPVSLSREPIGPMVRDDDLPWQKVVAATVHAVILAEELGLNQNNVDNVESDSVSGERANLLGTNTQLGEWLGLSPTWSKQVIKAVGNYGEIFDRNFGPNTPIGLDRGLNRLWSQGGVLYAPLFK